MVLFKVYKSLFGKTFSFRTARTRSQSWNHLKYKFSYMVRSSPYLNGFYVPIDDSLIIFYHHVVDDAEKMLCKTPSYFVCTRIGVPFYAITSHGKWRCRHWLFIVSGMEQWRFVTKNLRWWPVGREIEGREM